MSWYSLVEPVCGVLVCVSWAGAQTRSDIPRPEHPEPQAVRAEWLNLNGEWEFAETDDASDQSFLTRERWPDKIVVPFCRESKLSGLGRKGFVKNVWYRRRFDVPSAWNGRRVQLHIGACDWRTTVWVNGQEIGTHTGGNTPITLEITDSLRPGENTVIIRAFDDTRSGLQQLGKQSNRPESHGIFYTRTTGIWQTVWLEAVGTSFVNDFTLLPDPDQSRVVLRANVDGSRDGLTLRATALADGEKVGQASRSVSWGVTEVAIPLSSKRLWSVDEPFLYTATLRLERDSRIIDEVQTYFGLRKIEIRGPLFLINDKPVFQRLVLDQGFYPDGVWTAPSDEALRRDIELSKAAGFNGARLHQKVFEPRFHYWADKLGYLTWGETPSFGADYADPRANLPIIDEWRAIVRRDRNHPSIIGWCPFNETPREAGPLQNVIYDLTKQLDPTRPVIETSGWVKSHPSPDVDCRHDYTQEPERLAARWAHIDADRTFPPQYGILSPKRPFFLSEFGGIGWIPEGSQGWGYGNNPKTLAEFYERYAGLMRVLQDNRFMFGLCYTQLTDVEQERNGVYYFDRSPKFDTARIHAITSRAAAYERDPPTDVGARRVRWTTLVRSAVDSPKPAEWRYTTQRPADGWEAAGFDDAEWSRGAGGFGRKSGWESRIATPWDTPDIWLRREFEHDGGSFDAALVILHYDNATTIHVNGKRVLALQGWNDAYAPFDVTAALRPLLRKGRNVIAIHTHQDAGGQFIDLALLLANSD